MLKQVVYIATIVLTGYNYHRDEHFKENEMDTELEMRNAYAVLLENLEETHYSEDLDVDGKILEWILNEMGRFGQDSSGSG
jgi:hypothetical protein